MEEKRSLEALRVRLKVLCLQLSFEAFLEVYWGRLRVFYPQLSFGKSPAVKEAGQVKSFLESVRVWPPQRIKRILKATLLATVGRN